MDTGASAAFSHCLQDFISFTPLNSEVSGLGKLKIKGVGTIRYKVMTDSGEMAMLEIKNAYYVPALDTRLISPQQVCNQSKIPCSYTGTKNSFTLRWGKHSKTVTIDPNNNLPVMHTAPGVEKAKYIMANLTKHQCCFKSARTIPRFKIQNPSDDNDSDDDSTIEQTCKFIDTESQKDSKSDHISVSCSTKHCKDCVKLDVLQQEPGLDLSKINNLTQDQREFLAIHEKLDHLNFNSLKIFAKEGYIPKKFAKIEPPPCVSCILSKQHKLARNKTNKIVGEHITKPGDMIHMDQAVVTTPGRPMTLSGKNNKHKITCFTIFVDSVSKRVHIHFQNSTNSEQTIDGKINLERFATRYDVKLKHIRCDNGTFRSKAFVQHVKKCDQDISFCGVNAHHQNGIAERYIRTIVERGRTNFIHAATKWPSKLPDELWTFAMNHAVHQWNNTPRPDLNFFTPNEIFKGEVHRSIDESSENPKASPIDLSRDFHPFGCPVYVLEEALQEGQTLPKMDPRSRVGIFMGYSSQHASNVALVLNPETDHISPQYHIIFDDSFSTLTPKTFTEQWEMWDDLAQSARPRDPLTVSFKPETFSTSTFTNLTSYDEEIKEIKRKRGRPRKNIDVNNNKTKEKDTNRSVENPSESADKADDSQKGPSLPREIIESPPPNSKAEEPSNQSDIADKAAEPIDIRTILPPTEKVQQKRTRSGGYVQDPTKPSRASGIRVSKRMKRPSAKVKQAIRDSMYALAAKLRSTKPHLRCRLTFQETLDRIMDVSAIANGEINETHPLLYAASANPNILTHREAKKADDWDDFQASMKDEIGRMKKNEIFELVKRSIVPRNQRVLRAVWSHRRKTTPTGVVYRHRSRLCVDGSQQQHGIDYSETYSPVVSWSTVRILMILSKIFNMKMRQVDYVQAFPQATLPEGENVYMEIPDGYDMGDKSKDEYCLKLLKNLYGLKQAAYNWNSLLSAGLQTLGFKPSPNDPCLYIKKDIICVVYVDDTLFYSKTNEKIDETISQLKKLNFDLTDEGDVDAFLGVKVEQNEDNSIKMSQPDLISRVIETLGLESSSKQHKTPAVSPPLHAYENGAEREEKWNYRSVIGMLTYLARNTRPDIEYAVHQCARFQLNPKKAHENAVKRIGRYLLGTRDKGITFTPNKDNLDTLECFVDADFAGNYAKEINQDPNSVKSRTGCVIRYAGCPLHWFSRLQSEISLSTTEAEYIALSTAARELLPMRELLSEITETFGFTTKAPSIHCTLFEDNIGAETLAKAPKMNARTKHIAIKYHFFREAVRKGILRIKRVETKNQLADIFTKPVPQTTLEPLRKEIMGWLSLFHVRSMDVENETNFKIKCNFARLG